MKTGQIKIETVFNDDQWKAKYACRMDTAQSMTYGCNEASKFGLNFFG